jgi:hypothetical protein
MSWNAGYVTDVEYNFGYYSELNPLRANYALIMHGARPPAIRNACDLGFGQGVSLAIHAAAQPDVTWWGTDFNPAHTVSARRMIVASGAAAHVFDQSFDEFCGRDDLPEFEFIALHGIWSWINDENRKIIVDFVRRRLAVGGTLYISYNTLPGWSAQAPMRHLLKQHDLAMGASGTDRGQRIEKSLDFLDTLFATDPAYTRANPNFIEKAKLLRNHERSYLAHEYLNASWSPTYFTDVATSLEDAKVNFATSANFLEQQDSVTLTPAQTQFLAPISDSNLQETLRDFMTSRQFRRDLWVKGLRRMPPLEQVDVLRRLRFILLMNRADVPMKTATLQGEANLHEPIYSPLLDALADQKIHTFREIETAAAKAGVTLSNAANGLAILVGMGAVGVVQSEDMIRKAKPATAKLNAALLHDAAMAGDVKFLASPVIGGAVSMTRFTQMFLLARAQGLKAPEEWARAVYQTLSSQGQKFNKDGRLIEDPDESIALLLPEAVELEKRLPILQALGII